MINRMERGTDHGIMPHSNILLAMGAATLLMNAERICGSDFNISRASCSICGLGALPFSARSCHNCSQVDVWYFWMTLSAMIRSFRLVCCELVFEDGNRLILRVIESGH